MRGQVSLEYLILLAISLAAIALSATSLFSFSSQYKAQMEQAYAASVADQIKDAAWQVCTFGEGNSRTVEGLPAAFALAQDEISAKTANVEIGGKNASFELPCEMDMQATNYSSTIKIEYEGGKAKFTQ